MKLAYVTSAYNETLNLEELHRRCRLAWQSLAKELESETGQKLEFRMVIADNHSSDDSLATLQRITARDTEVIGIANAANYGPDASFANVLKHTRDCDLVVLLCSDLQDPPELSGEMVQHLLREEQTDAVLAMPARAPPGSSTARPIEREVIPRTSERLICLKRQGPCFRPTPLPAG